MSKFSSKYHVLGMLVGMHVLPVQAYELDYNHVKESEHLYQSSDSDLLAEIYFSKDHVMKFESDSESGDIYISESRSIFNGEELYGGMISGNPLEKFVQLTPNDVPIPGALFDHSYFYNSTEQTDKNTALIAGKSINTHINERGLTDEVVIDLGKHLMLNDAVSVNANKIDAGHSCLSGSPGEIYFSATQCLLGPASINHGSGWNQSYCDSGEYRNNIRRTSSRKVRSMYSRVANCGTGDAAIVHLQKVVNFNIKKTWFLGDDRIGGYETSTKYDNSIRLYRRAEIWKVTSGGFMRAKTVFWRNR